ncbi:hypothetical protein AB3S75_009225 [Citrus x aurantiifolia]
MIGKKMSNFFNEIKLKVYNKISNWQHKFFSCGGKEILIKAAMQAIPAYAMSVFKTPMGVCNDIQKAVANIWWGSKSDKRSIHWSKWEKLSQAKCKRGMGFRDFSSFNQALVAKQGWQILQFPNSLVAKVLQAKYYQNKDFMNAKLGSTPSFVWRSILWGRQILGSSARWRIGNGQKIRTHKDNWILKPSLPDDTLVAKLINEENQWDESLIYRHFNRMDADKIVEIPLPRSLKEYTIIWHYDKKCQYTIKSGYQTALSLKFLAMPSSLMLEKNQ